MRLKTLGVILFLILIPFFIFLTAYLLAAEPWNPPSEDARQAFETLLEKDNSTLNYEAEYLFDSGGYYSTKIILLHHSEEAQKISKQGTKYFKADGKIFSCYEGPKDRYSGGGKEWRCDEYTYYKGSFSEMISLLDFNDIFPNPRVHFADDREIAGGAAQCFKVNGKREGGESAGRAEHLEGPLTHTRSQKYSYSADVCFQKQNGIIALLDITFKIETTSSQGTRKSEESYQLLLKEMEIGTVTLADAEIPVLFEFNNPVCGAVYISIEITPYANLGETATLKVYSGSDTNAPLEAEKTISGILPAKISEERITFKLDNVLVDGVKRLELCFGKKCAEMTCLVSTPAPPACTDSDAGKSIFEEGYVTLGSKIALTKYPDSCAYDPDTNTHSVLEYYCDNYTLSVEQFECFHGCKDGACIPCIESDLGKEYYVKGYILNDNNIISEDECWDENTLIEYYCTGNWPEEALGPEYACPKGCEDAACVPLEEEDCVTVPFQDADKDGCYAGTDSDCGGIEGAVDSEITCSDGIDNDCDGFIDSEDPDGTCP